MKDNALVAARYGALAEKVQLYHPNPDLDLLRRTFEYACEAHDGQMRSSGEPYVTHPIEVAAIIADLKLDTGSLCAGLLHDVVEDTGRSVGELEDSFNAEIAFLVDGVTKLSKMRFNTSEERQAETIRKMIVAMSRDIRVVLVKLADRVHNMRTLDHLDPQKQRRISQETMDIYAPLANRLGIHWVKVELEDAAFRFLNREAYYDLAEKVAKKRRERERYIKEVLEILTRVGKEEGLKTAAFQGRPKHLYSIWNKMTTKNIRFEQVYDMLAFRILVDEKHQCYEALGVVHNLWRPIPARFKDYIAMPKANGYQSLHTSVIGPHRQPIEIQIRTKQMHQIAEAGVAAHWVYKEGAQGQKESEVSRFRWLRHLIEDFQEVSDPRDFMERLKLDLFSEEVFVFTPKGDIRAFPTGATALDFAYSIHTEVGDHCAGAKVNNAIVPLSYQLASGDVAEILTRANQRPKNDWLDLVKTGRARTKIKHYLRREAREQAINIGKTHLASEVRRLGHNLKTLTKKGKLDAAVEGVKLQSADEMYMKLGYGVLSIKHVLKHLVPDYEDRDAERRPSSSGMLAEISRRVRSLIPGAKRPRVRLDGIDDDLMVTYARCCNPVPGEPIVGFVTRGRGLTIHTRDCNQVSAFEPERQLDVEWDDTAVEDRDITRNVRVEVICDDTPGMLAAMSNVFSGLSINIREAHCRQSANGRAINTFDLTVNDAKQLERSLEKVRGLNGVLSVERVKKRA